MLVAFMVVLGKLGSILRVPSIIRLLKVKEATFRSILYSQGIFTSSPSYGTLNYHSSVPGAFAIAFAPSSSFMYCLLLAVGSVRRKFLILDSFSQSNPSVGQVSLQYTPFMSIY